MIKRTIERLMAGAVTLSLVLAACGPASTPIPAGDDEPTVAPTAADGGSEVEPTEGPVDEPTAPPDTGTEGGGTVTISFVQEPDNLSPLYTTMYFSAITRDFWLRGLFTLDDQLVPQPTLAAEVPTAENGGISADGLTITIKIREALTWSDGEPLTANDFVFTYEMIMADANTVSSRYPYDATFIADDGTETPFVESVTAADDQTLVIQFNRVFAAWQTSMFIYVLPEHVLRPVYDSAGSLNEAEWNNNPTVSIGPFMLEEWNRGSSLSFIRNPAWPEQPNVERIFIQMVPDDAAQEAAIIAGDVDLGLFLSSDQIPTLEAGGNVDVVTVQSGYSEGWFLNVREGLAHPGMLDPNVRRAIALATDRFTIVNDLLNPEINPVNASFWSNNPPYADESLEPYPYDPDEAGRLLDEAGWVDSDGDGTRDKVIDGEKVDLELRYATTTRELRRNVQAVVAQQWEAVGIRANLQNYESDLFFSGYEEGGPVAVGDFDIAEWSDLPTSFPDPDASEKWRCADIPTDENPSGGNWAGVCNEGLDALLAEQAGVTDRATRIDLYRQIQQIIYDETLYIGIWRDPDLWSVNTRVQGVSIGGVNPFWNVTTWTVVE
jgi:peptide/nickel transport system substrate-binding protein